AWLLPRAVGYARALELCATSDIVGVEEALRIGLVNKVVPAAALRSEAAALAERIAAMPPLAVGATKTLLQDAMTGSLESAPELDGSAHVPRRQLEGRLFARAALRHYEAEVLDQSVERCLADLDSQRGADGVVRTNLIELGRTILLQIAAAIIGLDDVQTGER